MIVFVITHVALAVAFAFLCHGVGRVIVRNDFAAATGLGYGILAQIFFFLATFGALTRMNVMIVFALATIASIPSLRALFPIRASAHEPRQTANRQPPTVGRFHLFVFAASIPSLLIVMYPVIGYDATMYHFVYARLFAEAGQLVFAEALRFPVFPQIAEMHFTAAILLFGDHAAQLTGWIALPVTALATASIVRQAGGGERAAWLAAVLWLGTPYAVYVSGSGYVDVTLTMFVTLGIASASPAIAGAFAGLAGGTKYHGLFFVPALARRRGLLAFVACAALFAAPWYIHIYRATGSPVFPFAAAVFGDHEYLTFVDRSVESVVENPSGVAGRNSSDPPFVTLVRRAIVEPMRMGTAPHSPLVILLLPFAIAGAAIAPRLRRALIAAAIYALLVSTLDWRFMLVVVPIVAAAISVALERLVAPRFTFLVVLLFLLPGLGWGTLLIATKYGPMPVAAESREAFVAKRIGVYRAVRALGPATVYVYAAPQMAYYCPGKCLGDYIGPYRFAVVEPLLSDPPALAGKLRSFGATHFVVDKSRAQFSAAPPFVRVYEDERAVAYEIRR